MPIDTDKAYLLGLLVGGGTIQGANLHIKFPYKRWGDLAKHPIRAGRISKDIATKLIPLWKSVYNVTVSFSARPDWSISSSSLPSTFISELRGLRLPIEGEYRVNADIGFLSTQLNSNSKKKRFVAGLVDTVGSMEPTHRRFTKNFQIVSFEFKDRNFDLVKSVIELLVELSCVPDQVLWNHPNLHSASDRYYLSWKKGFKIRVCLNDYILKGGFVFEAKKIAADENVARQNGETTSEDKSPKIIGRTTLHLDENSTWLPSHIRGYHFVHYLHMARFLGIDLPGDSNLENVLANIEGFVTPFTILTKGTKSDIHSIISSEDYLKSSKFTDSQLESDKLREAIEENQYKLVYGNSNEDGFPLANLAQGISFVIGMTTGKDMYGKRVRGNYLQNIFRYVDPLRKFGIRVYKPDRGTCLYVTNSKYSALIGYVNDSFNKTLITKDASYKYKLAEPKYSACVKI